MWACLLGYAVQDIVRWIIDDCHYRVMGLSGAVNSSQQGRQSAQPSPAEIIHRWSQHVPVPLTDGCMPLFPCWIRAGLRLPLSAAVTTRADAWTALRSHLAGRKQRCALLHPRIRPDYRD
jgi:hypothetical protein